MDIIYLENLPKNIIQDYKDQLLSLVVNGGQVKSNFVKTGIDNASLLAMLILEGKVIAGCCLKNPLSSYRKRIFKNTAAKENPELYRQELGYIATHPDFEGKGYCKQLLEKVFPTISSTYIFATTRKPAMTHILGKHGFYKTGNTYSKDLELFLYNPKQEQ